MEAIYALRRQRPQVRILSGAPVHLQNLAGTRDEQTSIARTDRVQVRALTHGETMFKYGVFIGYAAGKARRIIHGKFSYPQRMARRGRNNDAR